LAGASSAIGFTQSAQISYESRRPLDAENLPEGVYDKPVKTVTDHRQLFIAMCP